MESIVRSTANEKEKDEIPDRKSVASQISINQSFGKDVATSGEKMSTVRETSGETLQVPNEKSYTEVTMQEVKELNEDVCIEGKQEREAKRK